MDRKRELVSESCSNKVQKIHFDDDEQSNETDHIISLELSPVICNDTEAAILYLKNQLTSQNNVNSFPPVILIHQLFDIIKNRTVVTRQIEILKNEKKVILIHLGNEEHSRIVIFSQDLKESILKNRTLPEKLLFAKFCDKVFKNTVDIGISKINLLRKFRFSEKDIRSLVHAGLLILKETGTFWFSFPSAGIFMKNLLKGRQSLLKVIKKRRHRAILEMELRTHPIRKTLMFPLMYHVHDLVGGNFVDCGSKLLLTRQNS